MQRSRSETVSTENRTCAYLPNLHAVIRRISGLQLDTVVLQHLHELGRRLAPYLVGEKVHGRLDLASWYMPEYWNAEGVVDVDNVVDREVVLQGLLFA